MGKVSTKRFLGHTLEKDVKLDMWSNNDSGGLNITLNKHADDSWTIAVKLTLGGPVLFGSGNTERSASNDLIGRMNNVSKILSNFKGF